MSGATTYQIGGLFQAADGTLTDDWFPVSELVWPLDVYVASVHADCKVLDSVRVSAEVTKNISKAPGWMQDSDWIVAPDSLDIYSESRTRMGATIWNANVDYLVYTASNAAFMLGIGYLHQRFDYNAYSLYQEYPSGGGAPVEATGRVISYDINYDVPYVRGALEYDGPRLHAFLHLGWSPFASAEDVDNHLLRGRLAKGTSDKGSEYMAGIAADYKIYRAWTLGLKFDYTHIDTEGEEKIWMDNVYAGKEDWKAFSEQMMTQVTFGYSF